ncbi:MAG: 23S rRNA (uracil(1939)-C(5))-methyltransferase RlmD [Bacteroidales bacterium]|nr:23S rRNA (uracil(1939)-C(5))-methyltransferase RlmD [Bacteroidales bacterium]
MGRKKKYPRLNGLEIIDVAAEGKAIGKYEGMIVFVPQAVPGDVVDVQIIRKRKKYMEGVVINVKKYAEKRVEPFCEHFGVCGGCTWQQLPYPEQLRYKQKQVKDNLERIAKAEIPEMMPVIPSNHLVHYRNKLEYTFSENRWLTEDEVDSGLEITERKALGFHIPGRFDRVLDISHCHLQAEPSNRIRMAVKEYTLRNKYRFFDHTRQEGFLRTLTIRNTLKGEVMVILSFFEDNTGMIRNLMEFILKEFPRITSLFYVINPKGNDTFHDLDMQLYSGSDHIIEEIENLRFKIGPKSFFQTNTLQAIMLYRTARDFARLTGNETVYDLYTGTGTIALLLARYCKKVVGIEYVPEAIEDAKRNAVLNSIVNVNFSAGDIKIVLNDEFIAFHGKPDVMTIDPPRAGMHAGVVNRILKLLPGKIVYVSCNPATQARDIQLLSERYSLKKSQPVDMFPHTHHIENVVLMELRQ